MCAVNLTIVNRSILFTFVETSREMCVRGSSGHWPCSTFRVPFPFFEYHAPCFSSCVRFSINMAIYVQKKGKKERNGTPFPSHFFYSFPRFRNRSQFFPSYLHISMREFWISAFNLNFEPKVCSMIEVSKFESLNISNSISKIRLTFIFA